MNLPTVAIVGQPNVGKSSLFNRFIQRQLAVVDETPGVTRDRNYSMCDWNGVTFRLIDTGGMVPDAVEELDRFIYEQTEIAIEEAQVVLFVVDTKIGADHIDEEIARRLYKSEVPTILVANKCDNDAMELETYDFLRLGLGDPVPVSATVGRGTGDLLDKIVEMFPEPEEEEATGSGVIRVAVVGRPNVGKSSFINKLTGSDRAIVTPIAGTTRDAVDTEFEFEGQRYVLVDTAGLRKRFRVHENIEYYTTLRTSRAISSADVAVILIDATTGMTTQDQHVLEDVIETRRSALLAINKWDLVQKETGAAEKFAQEVNGVLAHYAFLPMVFISALTGQRVPKVLSLVKTVYERTQRKISTSELNDFLEATVARNHPPARKGKYIKLNYITQTSVGPPTFVVFANHPTLIDKSWIHYFSNRLREEYDFEGVPFRVKFRRK